MHQDSHGFTRRLSNVSETWDTDQRSSVQGKKSMVLFEGTNSEDLVKVADFIHARKKVSSMTEYLDES